tara:strand:+ start:433 stop:999 length:567 start_codon:yes stop_codon:yes gene_type:complete
LSIIGKNELIKLISNYECIRPFSSDLLDGDGYVLTVNEDTTLQYLEHRNLVTHEIVFTTPSQVAHLTAKSKYGRMGLSFLNAAKVHSGYVGRLALELVNMSNDRSPILVKKNDPLIHIEFISRTGDPSPYSGEYMFQYLSESEVNLYLSIIKNNFNSEFNIQKLEEIANNRFQTKSPTLKGKPVTPEV